MGSSPAGISALQWNILLRRSSIRRIADILKLIAVALMVIFLAAIIRELLDQTISQALVGGLSSNAVGPVQPEATVQRPDYTPISQKNIFGELQAQNQATTPQATPKPATSVALTLIGTFISSTEPPYAIVENKKNQEQDIFSIGESIFEAAKLVAIYSDRVEINRDGSIETLSLEEGGTGELGEGETVASTGQDQFVVSEVEVDKALENLPLLLSQARAVPYFKNGKSVGLRLFAIKRDSLYEKIGLKNGDILKSINGNSLGDITQAVKLFEKLKEERSITLTLERNGSPREFSYQIS